MPRDREYGVAPPAYRLPESTHVGSVLLQVRDLERSVDYYQSVIGLRILQSDATTIVLGPHGGDRPLVALRENRGAKPVPPGGRWGLFHFAILLPSREQLGRFVDHLGRRGVRFASADHLVSEAVYLTDPDGLGIEVYSDRPPASWRSRGRELQMATEPLDLRGLVAAAGQDAWSGVPERTTMGHVHLSVGDLDVARSFFHAALGLDVTVWSYPGALFLSAGGYHHHLGTNTWAANPTPAGDNDARLLEWELLLPDARDVESAVASLIAAGHAVMSQGDDRIAIDAWGTPVRLRRLP